jgi:glycosyltransferase involved in cell wall biosynthesis
VRDHPCRLAILASHPIQYFTPLYRRLASRPGIAVEVMYFRNFGVTAQYDRQFAREICWDTDQLSGYNYRFLRNLSPIHDTFNPLHAINPGAFTRLLTGYDALWVNGYMYPSNWLAVAAAKLSGIRVLFRSEFRLGLRVQQKWYDPVRERIVRWWIRRADALLYIGRQNREAYLSFGAATEQLFSAPYSVDTDVLAQAGHASEGTKNSWRREFGLPLDVPLILFAGKLTERKHPEALLHDSCIRAIRDQRAHIVYAGSGPVEASLRERAREAGMTNVSFLGFINQSALPRLYGLAEIFVLPSEAEPYGLALNEAMSAGAAPIATTEVGAVADLITDAETGYIIKPRDWDALGDRIADLLGDAELRRRIATAAMKRSNAYTFDVTVEGILSALAALGLYRSHVDETPDRH